MTGIQQTANLFILFGLRENRIDFIMQNGRWATLTPDLAK